MSSHYLASLNRIAFEIMEIHQLINVSLGFQIQWHGLHLRSSSTTVGIGISVGYCMIAAAWKQSTK
jgi:hypothetical protein